MPSSTRRACRSPHCSSWRPLLRLPDGGPHQRNGLHVRARDARTGLTAICALRPQAPSYARAASRGLGSGLCDGRRSAHGVRGGLAGRRGRGGARGLLRPAGERPWARLRMAGKQPRDPFRRLLPRPRVFSLSVAECGDRAGGLDARWSLPGAATPGQAEKLRQQLVDALAPLPRRPKLTLPGARITKVLAVVILPGNLLGMLTGVRILGPLAGLLVLAALLLNLTCAAGCRSPSTWPWRP